VLRVPSLRGELRRSAANLLRTIKDKLIRSYVIIQYTFVDEYLTDIIRNYYFHRPKKPYAKLCPAATARAS
jgi:hypothetical protein